jgi:hypothetical protein
MLPHPRLQCRKLSQEASDLGLSPAIGDSVCLESYISDPPPFFTRSDPSDTL